MFKTIKALPPGRAWAYAGVALGFSASITANVASTVLKDTTVSLALRIPFAIFWPLATYVAIEVLTRTAWARRSLAHFAVRVVIWVPVGSVAAFVSYLHQHHLMILANEPGMAQLFGPLAVDGMLFGMTATLIVTRRTSPIGERTDVTAEIERLEMLVAEQRADDAEYDVAQIEDLPEAPVSPAPAGERKTRASRTSWDWRTVAEMAMNGDAARDIHLKVGVGLSTAGRYTRVAKILREDARALVNPEAERIREDHIAFMRQLARVAR